MAPWAVWLSLPLNPSHLSTPVDHLAGAAANWWRDGIYFSLWLIFMSIAIG